MRTTGFCWQLTFGFILASLFEMASLMGTPKGVATGDSELDYFHGTLPG